MNKLNSKTTNDRLQEYCSSAQGKQKFNLGEFALADTGHGIATLNASRFIAELGRSAPQPVAG